jgi:hypothetical protein
MKSAEMKTAEEWVREWLMTLYGENWRQNYTTELSLPAIRLVEAIRKEQREACQKAARKIWDDDVGNNYPLSFAAFEHAILNAGVKDV